VTFLWSLIALVQVAFLPGYLITRRLRLDDGLVGTWIVAFGLSLIVNYHIMLILTLVGLQNRTALCGVIALEFIALVRLQRTHPPQRPEAGTSERLTRFLRRRDGSDPSDVSIGRLLLLLLGFAALAWFAMFLPKAFTSIFRGYDALVSWNRWAIDWSNGLLPVWTQRYPQLVPANWGMLYTIAGAPLQFLPKGLSVLFPLGTVAMFVDAGLRRSRPEYLLAAVLTAVLMSFHDGRYIASGYADLPVAFFALAPFYLLALCNDDGRERSTIVVSTLFVIGCALTKQAGLYLAVLFPVLLYAFLRRRSPEGSRTQQLRAIGFVVAAMLVLVVPWFVYKQIQLAHGFDTPGSAYSAGVHAGRSFSERAARAWLIWKTQLSAPLLWGLVLGTGLSAFHRRTAVVTLAITLPFTVIWLLFFSYDQRNLALAFPFIGLGAATGVGMASEWVLTRWRRSSGGARRTATALAIAGVVLALSVSDRGRIDAAHDRSLRELGSDEMNTFLYAYLEQHGFEGPILTNYRLLSLLPELREHVYYDRDATTREFWPFRDPDVFRSFLKHPRGKFRYIVVLKPLDLNILRILHIGIREGELEILYRTRGGLILRLRERPGR